MDVLRTSALTALLAGAIGAVGLTLRAGHRNSSRVLLVLFAFWVLSPFVALLYAGVISARWTMLTRAALHILTLVITSGTLAAYAVVALGPPRAKTATVFVLVPPISLLLMAIVLPIAALVTGKRSRIAD